MIISIFYQATIIILKVTKTFMRILRKIKTLMITDFTKTIKTMKIINNINKLTKIIPLNNNLGNIINQTIDKTISSLIKKIHMLEVNRLIFKISKYRVMINKILFKIFYSNNLKNNLNKQKMAKQ